MVNLRSIREGQRYDTIRLSKIVAETFIGPCPPGHMLVCVDGNKMNCYVDNLSYVTIDEYYEKYRQPWGTKKESGLVKVPYGTGVQAKVNGKHVKGPSDFVSKMPGGFNYRHYELPSKEKIMSEVLAGL